MNYFCGSIFLDNDFNKTKNMVIRLFKDKMAHFLMYYFTKKPKK